MELNDIFKSVKSASKGLLKLSEERVNEVLLAVADAAVEHTPEILAANSEDLSKM